MAALQHVVIAYETEMAAQARLVAHGYAPDIAAEIAVYLAQATDLPEHMAGICEALAAAGIGVSFVELDDLPARLADLPVPRAACLLWGLTDGIRFYRGSAVPALARLLGMARYGAPATAQHLCQDKFLSLTAARAAGVPCPPSVLMEGTAELGRIGDPPAPPLFVKPNTLGAKIGIFADSRCATAAEATQRAARLWDRYRDRAVIQPFIPGDDVRVSFLATRPGAFAAQLGMFRLAKDPASETGGAFMTMQDNETLSGARDTDGNRGGFGAARAAAFVPRMIDLRADPAAATMVAAIADSAGRLSRVLGLDDYFSMDFRIDAATGRPLFLEFEVCPAVTIYDFQTYLRDMHGLGLGAALARSFRLAHARHGRRDEA